MYKQAIAQQTQPNDAGAGGGGGAAGANGGTSPAPAWFGADANKPIVEAKGFKSVDDVFTSYTNLEKLFGAEKAGRTAVLPKDDKDVEGRKAFLAKIGVPEKSDGYVVPDALKDDPLIPATREAALEAGIPAASFKGFIEKVLTAADALRVKSDGELKAAADAELAAVKGEWGDKFDANAELARRLVKGAGISDEALAKMEGALGTAQFLKMFHSLSARIGEPGTPGSGAGQGGGNTFSMTPEVARARIQQLKDDRIAGKINEKELLDQMDKLGPMAYPG